MSRLRKVVLIGHCGPDAQMLGSAIRRAAPHARVSLVNDEHRLDEHLTRDSLLLINRVLDGDFTTDSGIGLIKSIAAEQREEVSDTKPDGGFREHAVVMTSAGPVMMLVSNYGDAQDHAVASGARRGFGKTQLYTDATIAALRKAIMLETASDEPVTA